VSEHDNNLKGMEVGEYISILEQENEELRRQVRFANKITDHYQKELVPGYRERAHKAEQQAAAYRGLLGEVLQLIRLNLHYPQPLRLIG
jgi:hypothetical protein